MTWKRSLTASAEVESEGIGQGQPQVVSKSALVNVLRSCNEGNLRLVVLNACNTRPQAEALTEVVDCVVSMNRTITDRAAIKFAASFYGALAFGRSVQKAFDQGVARLSAEGIAESDTPELLVRAGVDAAQLVLVGSAPSKAATPALDAPFIVPFPRNPDFVGRDGDLARLHASLSGRLRPGRHPPGGPDRHGRHRQDPARRRVRLPLPGTTIPTASSGSTPRTRSLTDWPRSAAGFVPKSERSRPSVNFKWRLRNSTADETPCSSSTTSTIPLSSLARSGPKESLSISPARVLFTTRHRELGRFHAVEVSVLPEEPALQLLLRHESRHTIRDDPNHPERHEAKAICRLLGWLPLALELAGAFFGEWPDISLADYRKRLQDEGCLPTLDTEVPDLAARQFPADSRRRGRGHLEDPVGRLEARPTRRPGSSSVSRDSSPKPRPSRPTRSVCSRECRTRHKPGHPSPLRRALKRLHDVRLVEELLEHRVRLHPLVREFAEALTPKDETPEFRHSCARRVATAFEDLTTLEEIVRSEGPDGLQQTLATALNFASESHDGARPYLRSMLRVFQRECHHLREWNHSLEPNRFAQQFLFRAVTLGETRLAENAERRLTDLAHPALILRWRTLSESPALVRILSGHQDAGEFRGGEPRRATHRLGVRGQDRGGLGPRNRHANSTGSPGIKLR